MAGRRCRSTDWALGGLLSDSTICFFDLNTRSISSQPTSTPQAKLRSHECRPLIPKLLMSRCWLVHSAPPAHVRTCAPSRSNKSETLHPSTASFFVLPCSPFTSLRSQSQSPRSYATATQQIVHAVPAASLLHSSTTTVAQPRVSATAGTLAHKRVADGRAKAAEEEVRVKELRAHSRAGKERLVYAYRSGCFENATKDN
jgi:hypothetical protein